MADYTKMSDAELLAAMQAQGQAQAPSADYSKMSDADLLAKLGAQQQINPLNNPQAYAMAASQMPTGALTNPAGNLTVMPGGMKLTPGAEIQSQITPEVEKQRQLIMPHVAEEALKETVKRNLSAQNQVAVDTALTDSLMQHLTSRSDDYAKAYSGGLAGGRLQTAIGGVVGQKPLIGGMDKVYDPNSLQAASRFDSSTNGMVARAQQYFASQVGTGNASTRLMTTVIDMLKGEFGDRSDSPNSMMGRNQGTVRTMYILQKAGNEYLNKLKLTPEQVEQMAPDAIDKLAKGVAGSTKDYELSPKDEKAIARQISLVNAPLAAISGKPHGAAFFSNSTGKWYDANKKEIK